MNRAFARAQDRAFARCARARALVASRPCATPPLHRRRRSGGGAGRAPAAFAADAVFGGSTSNGDPIVVRSDPDIQELRSLGISWRASAPTAHGSRGSPTLTPVKPVARLQPSGQRAARLAQRQGHASRAPSSPARISARWPPRSSVEVSGKLKPAGATGTLHAIVKIMDKATGSGGRLLRGARQLDRRRASPGSSTAARRPRTSRSCCGSTLRASASTTSSWPGTEAAPRQGDSPFARALRRLRHQAHRALRQPVRVRDAARRRRQEPLAVPAHRPRHEDEGQRRASRPRSPRPMPQAP